MLHLPTLALVVCMGANDTPAMSQERAREVLLEGPRLDAPGELASWLDARRGAVLKLPFTVWRQPTRKATLGVVRTPPEPGLRLDDGALGISLDDRLRHLCGEASPCTAWLSGRFGALLPMPGADPINTFSVLRVHGAVAEQEPLRAWSVHPADCLLIRTPRPLHCARGASRCEQCKKLASAPAVPSLLNVCVDLNAARPTVEVQRGGVKLRKPYEVLRRFDSPDEARDFARAQAIADVEP